MGIFSFNQGSYSKAGKGVEKDAKTLVRPLLFFTEYFGKYGKILLANVLYLVLCIPVITIGPATAGYTYVLKTLESGKHSFVASDFFEHFRKNLLQGFLMSLINLLVGYSMFLVIANFNVKELAHLQNFFMPLMVISILTAIMNFYIWPMMVTYDLSFPALLKNGFLFALIRLPMNLLIFVAFLLVLAIVFAVVYFLSALLSAMFGLTGIDPRVFAIFGVIAAVFIGTSMPAFLSVFSVMPTIRKNMEGADKKPEEEK